MFTIITKDNCPWCDKAEKLIISKGQGGVFIHYLDNPAIKHLMKKAGLKTVPQIWVDTPDGVTYIGGYEDLVNWFETHEAES